MIEFRYRIWKMLKNIYAFNERLIERLYEANQKRLGSTIDKIEGQDNFHEMDFEIEDLLSE